MAGGEAGLVVVGLGSEPGEAHRGVHGALVLAGRVVPAEAGDHVAVAVSLGAASDHLVHRRAFSQQAVGLSLQRADLGTRHVEVLDRGRHVKPLGGVLLQLVGKLLQQFQQLVELAVNVGVVVFEEFGFGFCQFQRLLQEFKLKVNSFLNPIKNVPCCHGCKPCGQASKFPSNYI